MAKKKITKIFFYFIPIIIIFAVGVMVATTMALFPTIGNNMATYTQVLGASNP